MNEDKAISIIYKRPDLLEFIKQQASEGLSEKLSVIEKIYKDTKQLPKIEILKEYWDIDTNISDADISFLLSDIEAYQKKKFVESLYADKENLSIEEVNSRWKKLVPDTKTARTYITISNSVEDITRDLLEMKKGEKRFPTGYTQLDDILKDSMGSGWIAGYYYCVQGLTGTNKTFILVNWAVKQLVFGRKVLFISSEMNAKQIHSRLYKTFFVEKDIEAINTRIKQAPVKMDLAVIEYGRSTASTDTIKSDIEKLPWKPDIIVLDYLDVLLPTRKYQQSWEAQAIVSDDICNLAKELDIPILTASQTNRSAAHDKIKGTKDHQGYETTGSSFGKTHQMAGLWSIRTNENDYDSTSKVRKLDLLCNKNRDGEESNSSYYLDYNTGKLYEAGELVNHEDAKEEYLWKAIERIKIKTPGETEEESEETIKNYNTYFENLKDDSNYSKEVDNIDKTKLTKKQKTRLKHQILVYLKQKGDVLLAEKTKNIRSKFDEFQNNK